MKTDQDPIAADRQFFVWLTDANIGAIHGLLTEDFLLIDVMRGGEVSRAALLEALQSGDLKFESIEPADVRVRSYSGTAIVTGRTKMRIKFLDNRIETHSRYTHVYVTVDGHLRLAAGQGTPIAESS